MLAERTTLYAALIARDPAYEGHAFVAVTTTGVFCRPTCAARKPRFENTRFYASAQACLDAGFRPCKRCRPLEPLGAPLVASLLDRLDREPDRVWSEAALAAAGWDPSTVRRAFRRHFGATFLDVARRQRVGRGVDRLEAGGRVIDAQLDAGYQSAGGFREAVARLIGTNPSGVAGEGTLRATWIETPLGPMLAVADADELHLLEFVDRPALPAELARLRARTGRGIAMGRVSPMASIEAELGAYFAGRSCAFATPLAPFGSAFTRRVWQALAAIPCGATRSYAEVAAAIGRPTAVRAVARANGANTVAIVVPCHRVIGVDGTLTGYGGGLWRKRWLIEHERRIAGGVPPEQGTLQ